MTDMFSHARKVRSVCGGVWLGIDTSVAADHHPCGPSTPFHTHTTPNRYPPLAKKTLGSTFTGTLRILLCVDWPPAPPPPPPKGQKPERKPPDAAWVGLFAKWVVRGKLSTTGSIHRCKLHQNGLGLGLSSYRGWPCRSRSGRAVDRYVRDV